MFRMLRVLLLTVIIVGFAGVANADIGDFPDTIDVDGIIYTKIIIDNEAYYTYDKALYIFDQESRMLVDAEISFPADTIEVDGIAYTFVIIDSEVFYECDGVIYVYDAESGKVLETEIPFPE